MKFKSLALALALVSLFACSKKDGGGNGEVSEKELDSIRESALPAISDADFEEFQTQIQKVYRLKSFHGKIVDKLGTKYISLPGATFGDLSAETTDRIKPACSLVDPQNTEHVKVAGINGCPVDITYDRDKNMKLEGNLETNLKVWSKTNEKLNVQYLSAEMQAASGFLSLVPTGMVEFNGVVVGKGGSGRVIKKKTLEAVYSSSDYPRLSARMVQRQIINDKNITLVERGYITLNGKLYVTTWFRDEVNHDPNDRMYVGNRLWKDSRYFGLPVPIIGDAAIEK